MAEQAAPLDAKTFWNFSVAWYQRQAVAQHCLTLQDEHGLNVNMVLLLAWCVQQQRLISTEAWVQLSQAIHSTEVSLKHHRQQRKNAKITQGASSQVYARLKEQELALERQQQADMLAALPSACLPRAPNKHDILRAFLDYATSVEDNSVRVLLETISKGGEEPPLVS